MSLLDENIEDLVEIEVYYKMKKMGKGKKLIIIEDEKAKELLEDEEKKKDVEKIITKWRLMDWKEQNEISRRSVSSVTNQLTGVPQRQFDPILYRDNVVKKCLKEWNQTKNGQPVPVTEELIDKLPSPIVMELHRKFEEMIDYTEEEVKN